MVLSLVGLFHWWWGCNATPVPEQHCEPNPQNMGECDQTADIPTIIKINGSELVPEIAMESENTRTEQHDAYCDKRISWDIKIELAVAIVHLDCYKSDGTFLFSTTTNI